MKKYELTTESIEMPLMKQCVTLYRIKALRDFSDVKAGDLGGFVESEDNLSHEEDCWIYNNAKVYDNASVYGNAMVYDNAEVYGHASIYGNAEVFGNAEVYDSAEVYGDAEVLDNAEIYGCARVLDNAEVYGHAKVYNSAKIFDNAKVSENSKVHGCAEVYGNTRIHGNAMVYGNVELSDYSRVNGNAKVFGHTIIRGGVHIYGNSIVGSTSDKTLTIVGSVNIKSNISADDDYIILKNVTTSGRQYLYTFKDDIWSIGCSTYTTEELEAHLEIVGSEKQKKEYTLAIEFVKGLIKLKQENV